MIRIGVLSDTHSRLYGLQRVRERMGPVDWLLHAGDYRRDAYRAASLLGLEQSQVSAVVGNCDYPVNQPSEELIIIGGVRIFLTHGHLYGVRRGLERLVYRAQEENAQVVVYGHTHVATNVDDGGLLLFNPGSLATPRWPQDPPSCGVLEIEGERVIGHLFYLDEKNPERETKISF